MSTTPPLPPLPPLPPSLGHGRHGAPDEVTPEREATPPAKAAPSMPALPDLSPSPTTTGATTDSAPLAASPSTATPTPVGAPAPAPAPAPAQAGSPAPPTTPPPARWELKRPGNPLPNTRPGTASRTARAQAKSSSRPAANAPAGRPGGPSRQRARPSLNRLGLAAIVVGAVAFVVALVLGVVFAVGVIGAVTTGSWPFGSSVAGGSDGAASGTDVVPARYGQTVTFDDGLQISVSEPESFSPSPEASGADQPANIAVTVTVYNGGTSDFVPGTVTAVSSAGTAGDPIVDPANGMSGLPPAATVPPGGTVTYVEAYSLADASDVVYVVTPAAAYLPARFTR